MTYVISIKNLVSPLIASKHFGPCPTCFVSVSAPDLLHFPEQSAACLAQAVQAFETAGPVFDPLACREWAEQFSEDRFKRQFIECVEEGWTVWQCNPRGVDSVAEQPTGA